MKSRYSYALTIKNKILRELTIIFVILISYFHLDFAGSASTKQAHKHIRHAPKTVTE